jgi:hypothetical protein
MSRGAAIPVGAVLGLALGIVVAVTADVPLAPEAGLLLGAWAAGSGAGRAREDLCVVVSGAPASSPPPARGSLPHRTTSRGAASDRFSTHGAVSSCPTAEVGIPRQSRCPRTAVSGRCAGCPGRPRAAVAVGARHALWRSFSLSSASRHRSAPARRPASPDGVPRLVAAWSSSDHRPPTKVTPTPRRPARPVRPTRCT